MKHQYSRWKRLTNFGSGNLENNQKIQVQGTKHKCSVHYKTLQNVSGGCYCLLGTICQVSEPRDANTTSAPTTAQPLKYPRPSWARSQDMLEWCPLPPSIPHAASARREEIATLPFYGIHAVLKDLEQPAWPTRGAGSFGKPSPHVLFASLKISAKWWRLVLLAAGSAGPADLLQVWGWGPGWGWRLGLGRPSLRWQAHSRLPSVPYMLSMLYRPPWLRGSRWSQI